MGSLGSKFRRPTRVQVQQVEEAPNSLPKEEDDCLCKKRKRNSDCDCDSDLEDGELSLETPCRKRLRTTSKYIYQTLFLNGENSDIKIRALGQVWKLHKVYLCQSGYFQSMFNGSWKESNMMEIKLEIPDQNIDIEALQVVFGSLYRDDVLIRPSKVIGIVAAARMLQLESLILQCGECMKENICTKTVCDYYSVAVTYGMEPVVRRCLEWLLNNLMTHQTIDLLKEIGIEVMERLVQCSDLFVMQVEMDVYTTVKKWMFLTVNPSWDGATKQLLTDADAWLCRRRTDLCDSEPFLDTDEGSPFRAVFGSLRLQYIINDLASARILERDNIVPADWLIGIYKRQWFAMLRTEFDSDIGPRQANRVDLENNTMRCGRKLFRDGDYCWRWTGFNFGFDLLVTYTNRVIVFKRNTLSQPTGGTVSLQPRRNMIYRLRLASFDDRGNMLHCRNTGYHLLNLEKDQEYIVMNLDARLLSFPLYLSCNFLYTSSPQETALPSSSP